jgi:hypothetical protein
MSIRHALLTCISFVDINTYWSRISRVLILLVDAGLNYYFLHTVRKGLVKYHGLTKYAPLVTFNACLMVVSIGMDVRFNILLEYAECPLLKWEMADRFTAYDNLPPVTSKPDGLHPIPSRCLHGEAQHRNVHGQSNPEDC